MLDWFFFILSYRILPAKSAHFLCNALLFRCLIAESYFIVHTLNSYTDLSNSDK